MRHVGKRKWYGKTEPSDCRIEISALCKTPESVEHTFLHELLHAAAIQMSWSKLNDDEDGIDALASLLRQALTTTK